MSLLIFFVIITLCGSFLCSLLEAVLLSATPAYVQVGVQEKKPSAIRMQKHKANLDRSLAAILTFNTVCNTMGAAGVGVQVLSLFGNYYVAFGSAALTLTILVVGEIIPKTLGASRWKSLAPFAGYTISILIFVLYPVVLLLELFSEMVGGNYHPRITKEEMIVTAELGASDGTLNKKESTIIKNLLMLDNIFVSDIMTPRSVLSAHDETTTIAQVMETQPSRFSRIPVFKEDLDHVTGFVHRYRILEAFSEDKDDMELSKIAQDIHTVPEGITVSAVLDQLIARGDHIFMAIDEYGSTVGLVTLEDAIETLLGVEIVDEFDSVVDLRAYALEQWKKRKQTRMAVRS